MLPQRQTSAPASSPSSSSSQRNVQQELQEKTDLVIELKQMLEHSKDSCHKLRQQNADLLQEAEAATSDLKSKMRNMQHELEEKNEIIHELNELLDQSKESCNKLRQDQLDLVQEARAAKALRDEIDFLNERVRTLDRLETEVQRYRERLSDMDFLKSRLEEMREENRLLTEGKFMLQEQLDAARRRAERLPDLEHQVIQLKALSLELQSQRDLDKEKTACLVDEVNQLRIEKKAAVDDLNQTQTELKYLRNQVKTLNCSSVSANLMDQLKNDTSTRLLKLELENQKLLSLVDNMNTGKSSDTCSSSSSTSSSSPSSSSCARTVTTTMSQRFSQLREHQQECHGSSDFVGSDAGEEMLLEEAGLLIFSPEAPISEPDSGCVSLVGELNLRLEKMERENCQLRVSIQRLNDSESRIRHLEDERIQCQAELQQLRARLESESLQTKQVQQNAAQLAAEAQHFQQQVTDLNQKLQELQQGSQVLEVENVKLQDSVTFLRSLESKLQELERQILVLESENERVAQDKESVTAEAAELQSLLHQKEDLISELGSKVSALEQERSGREEEVDEEKSRQCLRLQQMMEEQERLQQQLLQSQQRLQSVTDDLMGEKVRSADLTQEIESIRKTLDQVMMNQKKRAIAITSPTVRLAGVPVRSLTPTTTDSCHPSSSSPHHRHIHLPDDPSATHDHADDDCNNKRCSSINSRKSSQEEKRYHHSSDKVSSGTESEVESSSGNNDSPKSRTRTPISRSTARISSTPRSQADRDDEEDGDDRDLLPAISFSGSKFNPQVRPTV